MSRGFFNGSEEGYEKGYEDGLEGRSHDPVGSFWEAAAHVVRPEVYTDTFVEAYDSGWTDGNRKRNGV